MFRKLLCRSIAVLALALPTPLLAATFSNLYVLGDSLSDQGNLFEATSRVPGAPALPASDHYFAGRFSNGPVYTDLLAQALRLPLGPSLLGGNNFAFGGARTTYNIVESSVGGGFPVGLFPWSLNAEIAAFESRGINDPAGLYIVFSGSNDVADILARGMNPATVIPTTVGAILDAIDAFRNAGAQTVVVPNVPNLGSTPAFLNSAIPGAAAAATFFSMQFNAALHAALATVTDIDVIEFDTFSIFANIVANAEAFGFSEIATPCYSGFVAPNPDADECDNPDQHLFWDLVHPTTRVHGLLANALLLAIPVPSTLPLALVALLILAAATTARRLNRG